MSKVAASGRSGPSDSGLAVPASAVSAPRSVSRRKGGSDGAVAWPAWASAAPTRVSWTMRRSISTKVPDMGRSDQVASALTWKSTMRPAPVSSTVTSGVPSARLAQVRAARSGVGSASTCRLTRMPSGRGMPAKGPKLGKSASGCGSAQERAPPECTFALTQDDGHEWVV